MTQHFLTRRQAFTAAAGATALAGLRPARAADKITWRAVSNTRNSSQFTEKWQWLKKELAERTNGRLELEVTSFPEMGLTGQELIRILNNNLMDMAEVVTGYVSGDVPLMEGVQLPAVFTSYDQARRAYEAWMPAVAEPRARTLGGKPIATFAFSAQQLWSKFPVQNVADLKGKKIRVFAKAQADLFQSFGAEAVSIPLAEVYTALERGVVDAVVTGPESGAGQRLWEVLKYVVDLNLGVGGAYVVVSEGSLRRLPADIREILESLRPQMNEMGWALGAKDTETGLNQARQNGITTVIPAPPELSAALTKAAREVVVPAWVKRAGPQGADAFNKVIGPIVGFTV